MSDVTIRDYLGNQKELTAEQVRKLPIGTKIVRHSFDRYSAHVTIEMTVVQSGKKKVLMTRDWYGGKITKPISKETDRMCYSEV